MLIRKETNAIKGLGIPQLDDSFAFGNMKFTNDEEIASNDFLVKPRNFLSEQPTKFKGLILTRDKSGAIATIHHRKID